MNIKEVEQLKNVVGEVEEKDCVKDFVTRKMPERMLDPKDIVPKTVRTGMFSSKPTKVIQTGIIRASGTSPNRKHYNPLQPGCEIAIYGHNTVGTLGCFVTFYEWKGRNLIGLSSSFVPILKLMGVDLIPKVGILTNAHVVNKLSTSQRRERITQPWSSRLSQLIGRTVFSHPIVKGETNEYDVAIVELSSVRKVKSGKTTCDSFFFENLKDASVGEVTRKCGRTTNGTIGELLSKNVSVNVDFKDEGVIRFSGLDMHTTKVRGGDSGSIMTDFDGRPVGLIFASSHSYSFSIPIKKVIRMTGVKILE